MRKKNFELSQFERDQIAIHRGKGCSFADIGQLLGRSGSTISREYSRNLSSTGEYLPSIAHLKAVIRKSEAAERESKCEKHGKTIHDFLRLGWTPEQIAGWLKIAHKGFSVSYETIYCFIYKYSYSMGEVVAEKA